MHVFESQKITRFHGTNHFPRPDTCTLLSHFSLPFTIFRSSVGCMIADWALFHFLIGEF